MLTGWASPNGGLGEPLNVIISANSDKEVITLEGVKKYLKYVPPRHTLEI